MQVREFRNGNSLFLYKRTGVKERDEMKVSAEDIKRRAEKISEQIITDRRRLHQIPETGLNLPGTTACVEKQWA